MTAWSPKTTTTWTWPASSPSWAPSAEPWVTAEARPLAGLASGDAGGDGEPRQFEAPVSLEGSQRRVEGRPNGVELSVADGGDELGDGAGDRRAHLPVVVGVCEAH